MKVIFAPEAERDLLAAVEFLSGRNPAAAMRLYTNVADIVGRLADGAFEGPEQRLRSGAIVRSWPVSPYRIYHQARRPIIR